MTVTGRRLLTQNREMRKDRVFNWTLPAWVVRLPDGRHVNVCPQAGACIKVCYARQGTYLFPAVRAAHIRNYLETCDLPKWQAAMLTELGHRRYRPTGIARLPDLPREHLGPEVTELLDSGAACIRIHDAGDFHSANYLRAWRAIAEAVPDALFYAYTKEVAMVQAEPAPWPPNLLICYSMGGRQDHLINRDVDRYADVFTDEATVWAAGAYSQDAHDLLCVVAPSHRIGIPANRIPAFRARMAGRSFGEMQADLDNGAARHRG